MILGKWPTWLTILFMYLFLFLTLYMFRTHNAHHQERQIVSIQSLVAVTLCRWPCRVHMGSSVAVLHARRQKLLQAFSLNVQTGVNKEWRDICLINFADSQAEAHPWEEEYSKRSWTRHRRQWYSYEGWNINSGNYLFTTDTK